jgi:CTP synthase (UTP-ammonia lyase)
LHTISANALTDAKMNMNNGERHVNRPNLPLLALVGDHSSAVPAHRAIPRALELACAATGCEVSWRWFPTGEIQNASRDLADCAAIWVVPASPYANMTGALDAIQWARETGRPFLGTCGGFQHALIEFARNVAGLAAADHAESNEQADTLLVTRLDCPLVEKTGTLHFASGSRLRSAYGSGQATEGYHCNYGLNVEYRARLEDAGLYFSGFDEAGAARAIELPSHPFFIGTLFQPERSALRGEGHPLIRAFVRACGLGQQKIAEAGKKTAAPKP